MTTILPTFLTGFLTSAALIMAIGAQNVFVLRQGLRREHVGPIVLFCACADAALILAGVNGVGAFLSAAPQLATALALAGAAFLSWYGIQAFQRMAKPSAMVLEEGTGVSVGRALATTAAFTFLNPHVYLDTLLLMGSAGAAQPADVRPIFVAGAVTASFAWFSSLGFGAQFLRPVFTKPSAWRVLDGIVGVIMLSMATMLILRVV